jgi:RNA polymerase sigma factor (sigma-70 family)
MQAGDATALGVLYDRHVAGIHDFLARFTRDPAAAEDLAQRTFLRAWERRATLRDRSRVRGWLYATAHHLALLHVERGPRTDSIDDGGGAGIADAAPEPEREALSREAAELVWAAAASLETRQYAVLDLVVRRGLTTREVADVLGVAVAHAAVLVDRSREALANAVRYLLVARRREHCDGLAALVPAGLRVLTAQERSAVDHHLRRCERCRDLGERLTSPAELLGALLPLPLPAGLGDAGRHQLVASVRAMDPNAAGAGDRASWPPRRWPWDGRPAWAVAVALLLLLAVLGGGGVAVSRLRTSQPERAVRPVNAAATPSPAEPTATPSPSDSPSPSPSPVAVVPVAIRPSPTPAHAPATPPPPAAPTLSIRQVTLAQNGTSCPFNRAAQTFACLFTVTLVVADADGRASLAGTLTASTLQRETNTVSFAMTPTRGQTTVTVPVTATLRTIPCGTASVTTQRPTVVRSATRTFGPCTG